MEVKTIMKYHPFLREARTHHAQVTVGSFMGLEGDENRLLLRVGRHPGDMSVFDLTNILPELRRVANLVWVRRKSDWVRPVPPKAMTEMIADAAAEVGQHIDALKMLVANEHMRTYVDVPKARETLTRLEGKREGLLAARDIILNTLPKRRD